MIYVGKAANLSQRLYEHTYSMVAGTTYTTLTNWRKGYGVRYCSGSNQLGREFYDNPQRVRELALANAGVYRFYWALVEKSLCEVVEWCLIDALRNSADSGSLDWSRRGFRELQEPNIRIENPLPGCQNRTGGSVGVSTLTQKGQTEMTNSAYGDCVDRESCPVVVSKR